MPETVNIRHEDKIAAKALVSITNDISIQKKAFASLIGLGAIKQCLEGEGVAVLSVNNNYSGLLLFQDYDIASIITEDNVKIAARVVVEDDCSRIKIPTLHFYKDMSADIYVGLRIDNDLNNVEILGFIDAEQINRQDNNGDYIAIDFNSLNPISEIKSFIGAIQKSGKKKLVFSEEEHDKTKELLFKYIDGRIINGDKEFLVRHILSCAECSKEFDRIIKIDNLIKASKQKISFEEEQTVEEEIDCTLEIFSGEPELFGEEVEINIEEETEEEIIEDVCDDEFSEEELDFFEIQEEEGEESKEEEDVLYTEDEIFIVDEFVEELKEEPIGELNEDTIGAIAEESIIEVNEGFNEEPALEIKNEEEIDFPDDDVMADMDDLFASLDDVEVVDSSEIIDFADNANTDGTDNAGNNEESLTAPPEEHNFTFENKELNLVDDTITESIFDTREQVDNLNNEQQEKFNIIDSMYEEDDSVPEKYKGIKFDETSEDDSNFENAEEKESAPLENLSSEENIEEKNNIEEEPVQVQNIVDLQYKGEENKFWQSGKFKIAAGVTAAGLVAAIAVYLWANNNQKEVSLLKTKEEVAKSAAALPKKEHLVNKVTNEDEDGPGNESDNYTKPAVYKKRPKPKSNVNSNLNAILAEAYTRRTYEVDIRNVSWEIPADMANNLVFKNYIMLTGQALKSTLSRNLALAKEQAINDSMQIKTIIDVNGNVRDTAIAQSSGSQEIDKICLDTYNATIQFTKLPKIQANRESINANLIIRF